MSSYLHQKITFLPQLPSDNESHERALNLILKRLYLYLPGSLFLVNFTAPNKQLPSVKSVFKYLDYVSNS